MLMSVYINVSLLFTVLYIEFTKIFNQETQNSFEEELPKEVEHAQNEARQDSFDDEEFPEDIQDVIGNEEEDNTPDEEEEQQPDDVPEEEQVIETPPATPPATPPPTPYQEDMMEDTSEDVKLIPEDVLDAMEEEEQEDD